MSIERALQMLREAAHRSIYEGRDGFFYVDYSDGRSPRITRTEVEALLKQRRLVRRYPDFDGFYIEAKP